MLFELIAKKETEQGAIDLLASVALMKEVWKTAEKHGFDAFVKWYPKDKADYVPTGNTYEIKTVEDIAALSPQQFEFFIDDLRQFCDTMRGVGVMKALWVKVETNVGMTWVDDGDNNAKVQYTVTTTNKV